MAGVSSMIRHEKLLWQPYGEPAAHGRGPSDPKKSSGFATVGLKQSHDVFGGNPLLARRLGTQIAARPRLWQTIARQVYWVAAGALSGMSSS